MTFTSWLKSLIGMAGRTARATPRRTATRRRCVVPRLDVLEDRTLPSTFTVLNLNDAGTGSLRAAITAANTNVGADTITFAKGLSGTIKLKTGELLITDSVTIKGTGADNLAVSGNGASRVFETAAGLNVTISGLTITKGYAADQGGGILNDGSNLTLSGDDLTHNVVFESATDGARGGACGASAVRSPSTTAKLMPTRRLAVPVRQRSETHSVAASTSWPALRRSAPARSAITWPAEATTAAMATARAAASKLCPEAR